MISNCGHDENNRYKGGKAGDQTGQEWAIIPWYSRPWNVVLRYPNESVGKKIAELAEKAAKNNNIGYDQNERGTYWNCLRASGYDPSKIAELCEADCSSGVVANIKAVGYLLGRVLDLKHYMTKSIYHQTSIYSLVIFYYTKVIM